MKKVRKLKEKLKRLKKELVFSKRRYNEIYYSRTWQSFLLAKHLIKKLKHKFSLNFFPPQRITDLSGILKEARLDPKKFVLINFSSIGWQRKKQRLQQLCQQFVQDGHLVFYINSHFIVEAKKGLDKVQVARKVEIRKIKERIYQVSLIACHDLAIIRDKIEDEWDKKYLNWSVESLRKTIGKKRVIVKVDCPFWQPIVKDSKDFLIYDCTDELSGFLAAGAMVELEPLVAKKADAVLATSQVLYEKMKKYNKKCFLVENAADFDHFSKKPKKIPKDIKGIKQPIIGYYGAIADWLDEQLLLYLASKRPDWQFVLIGNISEPTKIKLLEERGNIHIIKEKSYKDLPLYLNFFDVCLIPFLKNSLTRAVNPIKFFEYLAAGKPVVSIDLPEVEKYQEYVYLGRNKEEFLEKIELALNENKSVLKRRRQNFAKKNTWQERFKQIKSIITDSLQERQEKTAPGAELAELIVCSPQLGIAPQSNSGGEVYDREVIKALCQIGIKTIVILPKNKPYLLHKNLNVYHIPLPFVWPPYLFNFFVVPWLFWIYKKYKFNILRVHSPYFVGLGALVFKLFYPQIPSVVTYHHLEEKKFIFGFLNKLFIHKWDQIICVSKFTKEEIVKKYKVDKKKIFVIYNGVDKKFEPKKKRKYLVNKYKLKNKKVLMFLGGLKPRKNISFLINVFSKINLSNVKLLICGQGSLYRNLVKQVIKLGLEDKIIFTGFVPERDKVDYYNLADIFLFPSKKEGFGMPIIEAGACGVPAVASNVASLKELIIDGKTGYLVKFDDLKDWQTKIEKLLSDDNLRQKMAKQAQKFAKNFSWDKTTQKQIEIYKKQLAINN